MQRRPAVELSHIVHDHPFRAIAGDQGFEDGTSIAEFDIEIRGKVGSTNFFWLIECRDRPGDGPAPSAWIEQLVGRRDRFGFNKVTAVSTTGFAPGAVKYAKESGIELREVKELSEEYFLPWLGVHYMELQERGCELAHFYLEIDPKAPEDCIQACVDLLSRTPIDKVFLRSALTGAQVRPTDAFGAAVDAIPAIMDPIIPNGPPKRVRIHVRYANCNDRWNIDTHQGPVGIEAITFRGSVRLKESLVPAQISEYGLVATGEIISQIATFPISSVERQYSVELHRISQTGMTHVAIRELRKDANKREPKKTLGLLENRVGDFGSF